MRALSSSISAFRDLAHSLSESGRTISSDGESGEERRGAGQNVVLLSPFAMKCAFPTSCWCGGPSIGPRVPLISLISFP